MTYGVDDELTTFVLLKSVDVRVAKNGKKYLAIIFQDESGEISGKYWDASDEDIAQFVAGQVVQLHGKRETYQGSPQIKIYHLRLATDTEPNDPKLYVEHSPMKRDDMVNEISQTLFEITEPSWNRIIRFLLKEKQEAFFDFPAAKTNHHAFEGGLAYHTISILRLAHSVVKQYPALNGPLLYAGAILHDLGKTSELSGPVSTTYTNEGNLLGHISIVDGDIVRACVQLKIDPDDESVILLRHMVLSHHGELDYGSPVAPELMEAQVLHDLDEMDASIMMLSAALGKTEPGHFTERLFAMDGRRFFRPTRLPEQVPEKGQ
ncbi:3'-5' exoribonuclease YhaM family protein [Levilactobacillus bambusae]|uniref:3'-5' exonuclease n=1 Tax=Levilactobacillus bambusae TaxID=2024736 RepID=A0A2V1N2L1_9LACO|nr:OB-fold nucleic acid binding domain-containing protein [Levilactobacillus bambusae]PWG01123.1 3'-5' exonuclease [Levilactobacillus bambusae]